MNTFRTHVSDANEYFVIDGNINRYCSEIPSSSTESLLSIESEYISKLACSPDKTPDDFPENARLVYVPHLQPGNLQWYCATHHASVVPKEYFPAEFRRVRLGDGDTYTPDGTDASSRLAYLQ